MSDRTTNPRKTWRHRASTVALVSVIVFALGACSSTPKRDAKGFCTAYIDVARKATRLPAPEDVAPATLRQKVGVIDDAATKAAKSAPDDIAPDVQQVIGPLHTLKADLDDAKSSVAVTRALDRYRVGAAGVTTSQRRVDAWAASHCGVTPVTSTTVPVTIQTTLPG